MKVVTPEISWHGKDAIFSIDIQPVVKSHPKRLATAGLDSNVRIWQIKNHEIKFLSNLSRHEKAVNIVRFAKKSLVLASGGDDGTIVLWKLSENEDLPKIFTSEEGDNIEVWNAFKSLRGHLEDVIDLCWSRDDLHLISGSVDHTAILWDVEKGQKLAILSDSKHFINGVAWDPLGSYVATMSCDRSLRIYSLQTKKMIHCVNKMTNNNPDTNAKGQTVKSQRIFHDETVVRRRLNFTVDGKLLITPAGCLQTNGTSQTVNTVMIFGRNNLSKPCVYLPGLQEPACVVASCPVLFELRNCSTEPTFKLEYRHIFAVASSDTVLLYDTQQSTPFAIVSNIHYSSITDLSWSPDASFLAISSRDGFCSIVFFDEQELGRHYTAPTCEAQLQKSTTACEQSECNVVADAPTDDIKNVEKEKNDKENVDVSSKDVEKMEVEDSKSEKDVHKPTILAKDPSNMKDKGDGNIKEQENSSKPRRVVLETVTTTPGGTPPLAEKQNSTQKTNGPRRVQLISVQK